MDVKDIPQELIDLLDERAGKKHSKDGPVLQTLAEILTTYNELSRKYQELEDSPIEDWEIVHLAKNITIEPSAEPPTQPAMPSSRQSHTYRCNLCGNTTFTFEPPIKITQEFTICAATKPGNWPMHQFLQTCILEKGHPGKHYSVLEIENSW